MSIVVRAELRLRPGARAAFVEVATALAAAAADEAGTLRYTWYGSADPDVVVVLEEYADPAAALAHNQHCAPLLARAAELAEITSAHLHGRLGPELEAWVAGQPFAHAHPPLAARPA
jgi:quinol monooxygenase YgiN